MKAALSIVLGSFFFACLVAPLPLAGQACQGLAVPTGSPSVWITSEDGIRNKLAVGGRYTGERLYGVASFGRRRSGGSRTQFNNDGTTSIISSKFHSLEGAAGFGLILMPTSPWSVCLGAGGLYGASNSGDVFTFRYFGNTLIDQVNETVNGDFSSWNTALEASVGFVLGEAPVWAPRAGISFEYGGQTFDGVSDTYTGFVIDIGAGFRNRRVLGLFTYFRVLTREFSDSSDPPGTCRCPDGLKVGLGVLF